MTAQQEVEELRNKLETQTQDFQNYKTQCKQLEQFLEEESNKKEDEIRKLKEQSIKKEKNFNLLKTQVSQLESQNSTLKNQLKEKEGSPSNSEDLQKQMNSLKDSLSSAKKQNQQLKGKLQTLQKEMKQVNETKLIKESQNSEKNESSLNQKQQIISELQQEVAKLRAEIEKKSTRIEQKVSSKKQAAHQHKSEAKQSKGNGNGNSQVEHLQKKLTESRHQTEIAEENLVKLSKQLKQVKQKSHHLSTDREKLSKKVKELSSALSRQKSEHIKEVSEEFEEHHENEINLSTDSLSIKALMMTKKHYVSPFLELKGENQIKLYKNTKNGCFEKSLGALKYKLNQISYDSEKIVGQSSKTIIENFQNGINSSVIFFGAKKTTKKYLMSSLVTQIRDNIIDFIDGSQYPPEAQYIKSSQDQQKKFEMHGKDRDQVLGVMDKVIELGQKSPKKQEIVLKKKGPSKPKVRYFKLSLGQNYIEIITTSHTNLNIRQTATTLQALNNICYSRLPNVLQSVECSRILVLMINPIVNLYDDCKNTLAIANCKKHSFPVEHYEASDWQNSPVKEEMLNESARKKLQSIERESEQSSLKVRRLEEEITFFKSRFDELEVRLKNLLNTHGRQNTYLKKSPVTLSYEKMLKFVHSVLARNGSGPNMSVTKNLEFNQESFHDGYSSGEEIL